MGEGGLGAPERRPIAWRDDAYLDPGKLDAEVRRVFDICHGCRRCFNLCDSFPRLFDLIDDSESGELDGVASAGFKGVVDACTLCDMCFMTKCPYVPPHEFDLDFPHLMLRYRALEFSQGQVGLAKRQLAETDRNGRLGCGVAPIANWASRRDNATTRGLMERVLGVHRGAALPEFARRPLTDAARAIAVNADAPAFGRKVALFATCFCNYNDTAIAAAALSVLARNGVETEIVYPGCCAMPHLENGDLARVAESARTAADALVPWIERGYDVVAPVPSCALMMKFEWPLIVTGDEAIARVASATFDVSEYVVDIARKEGLADGLKPLDGDVTLLMACHARAQNMGQKAREMLELIPGASVSVIERCSGHGGTWGVMKDNFAVALKIGRPVVREAARNRVPYVVSECPLAREHIVQGMEEVDAAAAPVRDLRHPIQLLARAYET
ncbi:MAG: heterodisulfide reductase-related iron-sulfur binding cluster [Rhodospirillales bacterium]|jgi:glycerol-3-phosphate dehydrogenase subunit C|nr:heterodisulfide reductase-related iron-sulfur binding cluster [Rhodospirillales bacterium]